MRARVKRTRRLRRIARWGFAFVFVFGVAALSLGTWQSYQNRFRSVVGNFGSYRPASWKPIFEVDEIVTVECTDGSHSRALPDHPYWIAGLGNQDPQQKGWRVVAITHSRSNRALSPPAAVSPDDVAAEQYARAAIDGHIATTPRERAPLTYS
jgi:hypothetical protein